MRKIRIKSSTFSRGTPDPPTSPDLPAQWLFNSPPQTFTPRLYPDLIRLETTIKSKGVVTLILHLPYPPGHYWTSCRLISIPRRLRRKKKNQKETTTNKKEKSSSYRNQPSRSWLVRDVLPPKISSFGAKVPAGPRFRAKRRNNRRERFGQTRRELLG